METHEAMTSSFEVASMIRTSCQIPSLRVLPFVAERFGLLLSCCTLRQYHKCVRAVSIVKQNA